MGYTTARVRESLEVVPTDALPLLAAGRLDRRLFDVLTLRRFGYTDDRRADIPLLVATRAGSVRTPQVRTGARAIRTFSRLGIRQVSVAKGSQAFWRATRRAPRGEKLWLVGQRHILLDQSVKQIGAPTAWARGLTGRGVTVAVLDTGYDATHPDLKGVVTKTKDFTGQGMKDDVGHGTHVASIIAGRGTASKGRYTGVAKGAKLAIGRVCSSEYCMDDAILAGMEWAATSSGARIVSMSLGGMAAGPDDPLEQAAQRLTAATGVLFVCAAGNEGPVQNTVSAPASAPAALAVGSVGRTDKISYFSSRGPVVYPDRGGPYRLKPDLTAPGEDIAAARAVGTTLGQVVNARYVRASGTSMATPHVAGAAAILLQEHPRWRAAQLKAGLTSTAKPSAGATTYDQGAGRVDVARAVTTRLTTSTGALDFGYQRWPNAKAAPTSRTITYGNTGTTALTLTLRAALSDEGGKAAPAGALTLDHTSVTIPAHSSALVKVTYRSATVRSGLVSGWLTATAGKARAVTALGGYREPESYDVTFTAYNRAGERASDAAQVVLTDRSADEDVSAFTFGGTMVRRLPRGQYSLAAVVADVDPASGNSVKATLEARDVTVSGPTEVVLDARRGKPVRTTLDRPDAVSNGQIALDANTHITGDDSWVELGVEGAAGHIYAVPGGARNVFWSLNSQYTQRDSGPQNPTSWVYHVARTADRMPVDPTFAFHRSEFAAIQGTYAWQAPSETRKTFVSAFPPSAVTVPLWGVPLYQNNRRTDHLPAGMLGLRSLESSYKGRQFGYLNADQQEYQTGRTYHDRWNSAVMSTCFDSDHDPAYQISRLGNHIEGLFYMFCDAAGHRDAPDVPPYEGTVRLLRNGKQLQRSSVGDFAVVVSDVPAAVATYRMEFDVRRSVSWSTLSSAERVAWTFRSAHVAGKRPVALPLGIVRFAPAVDALNRAPAGRVVDLPVRYQRVPGAATAILRTLTVAVSYDGGKTWRRAVVKGTGATRTARLTYPKKRGSVSLRSVAIDTTGGRVEQTIINAYRTR